MNDVTQNQPDQDLLHAWASRREPAAFAALVARHAGFVRAVALRALWTDQDAADDVTQAVFLLLSEQASRVTATPSLRPWLHRATCYAAANARRMAGRRRKHEQAAAVQRPETRMNQDANPIADEHLDAAINRLPAGDRELIISRYLEDRSDDDLAGSLQLSRATLQRRLSRALERLRAHLGSRAPIAAALPAILARLPDSAATPALQQHIIQSATQAATDGTVMAIAGLTRRSFEMAKWITVGKVAATAAIVVASCTGAVLVAQTMSNHPAPHAPAAPATVAGQPAATTDADVAATKKQLQGRWRFVAWWKEGEPMPLEVLTQAEMRISDDRLDITRPGAGSESGTFTLSAGGPLVEIDLLGGDRPDHVIPGVVSVDGNKLRISFDGKNFKRPIGFMPKVRSPKGLELERIEGDAAEAIKLNGNERATVIRLDGKPTNGAAPETMTDRGGSPETIEVPTVTIIGIETGTTQPIESKR